MACINERKRDRDPAYTRLADRRVSVQQNTDRDFVDARLLVAMAIMAIVIAVVIGLIVGRAGSDVSNRQRERLEGCLDDIDNVDRDSKPAETPDSPAQPETTPAPATVLGGSVPCNAAHSTPSGMARVDLGGTR